MGSLSPMHWLIVIGVLVLLFGAKKLPDLARSVGQSARVLKGEMKDLTHDSADHAVAPGPGSAPVARQAPGSTVPVEEPTATAPRPDPVG